MNVLLRIPKTFSYGFSFFSSGKRFIIRDLECPLLTIDINPD